LLGAAIVNFVRTQRLIVSALFLAFLAAAPFSLFADAPLDSAAVEFFENKIRPVLADHCYGCHSQQAEKLKGGLYLDTKAGVLTGGENGPAIVPGNPEVSLLIKAVRYTDDHLQMPPKDKKLSNEQIADLEAWVKAGAPDPRTGQNKALEDREGKKKNHWSFQKVAKPSLPEVANIAWVRNPIDAFVLAKLEQKGMQPSPKADPRTLARRAALNLTGLPPEPEAAEAFAADASARAWDTLLDRLLASPQYGETWARHWLDVARYADTKGYVFEEERRYAYSYTYRDYVIRAFNEDLPFDRFITEQLAADLLPLGEDKRPLAAMGFLTLGRRFLNNPPDIIDDRIDVVTRGFMGLTVQCARCHDHKFDPIPTKDYYSLYGIFASSHEPAEKPLLGAASLPAEYPEYEAERKKRETELAEFRQSKFDEVRAENRAKAAEYMLAALEAEKLGDGSKIENLAKERKLHPQVVRRWMNFFENRRKMERDPILGPWLELGRIPEANFAAEAKAVAARVSASSAPAEVNALIAKSFAGLEFPSLKEAAAVYKKLFEEVETSWKAAKKENSSVGKLASAELEAIRDVLYAEAAPSQVPDSEIPPLFDVPTAQKSRALKRKLEELDAVHPGSPPRGMVLQDNAQPEKPRVFVRGNARNPGEEVARQFLELIEGKDRKPFTKGSGRLELAQAIASPDNPLTARVMVNRIWLSHFGAGLVRTPSDFGLRSDDPTHPELLDYLAAWFVENGWSVKKLHKLILASNTFQQSSAENPVYAEKDPANTLLWRMNRRRLEFEPFRDSILAVAGSLNRAQGGQPVEITTRPYTVRRSVYSFIERQNLPGIFRTFDFASPDTSSAQRFSTTVPQQALFMMNSPFLAEQARHLARLPEIAAQPAGREKIASLYRAALQRGPDSDEATLAESFIAQQSKLPVPEPPVETWQYGRGTLELAAHRLADFQAFPHFTGKAWQGGGKLPDDKLGWLTLSATGGHPGEGLGNVVVRRWVAPFDCSVSISGALEHKAEAGDGVRGHVISSRAGALGFWPVQNAKREMQIPRVAVAKGETIDFVVDSAGDHNSDSFTWSPVIQVIGSAGGSSSDAAWKAREDFSGPKEPPIFLNPWEKFAQVLLMSNELAFVD